MTEWLLAMYDAGFELNVIQRISAFTGLQTKNRLKAALDAASGPAPTDIIIRNPDGEPTRVSWLDTNRNLMHRPFDGAFPADYPAELAIRQCTEILYRLLGYPNNSARDRAYTMLSITEAGLHSFDYDTGRWVHAELEKAGLDEDTKRTVILKLHPQRGRRPTPTPEVWDEFQVDHRQRSQDPVPAHETLRILASLDPQRGRTPGQRPRHLLHDRTRLPDTGTVRRRESARHTSAAKSRFHKQSNRKRPSDVRSAA